MANNNQMEMTVALSASGAADVRKALNTVGRAVKESAQEMEHAGRGAHGFGEAMNGVKDALGKINGLAGPAAGEIAEFAGAFARLGGGMAGVVAAITAATAALGALALHGAEAAAKIEEGAKRAGTTGENYQGLAYAFQQTGSSAEGMEKALGKISEAQSKALESANNYDEMAKQVQKDNADMERSARSYAEQIHRIYSQLFESQRTSALNASEEIRRVQMQANKEAARNAKDAERIHQDASERIGEIQRSAALRQREERRKANLEAQRDQAEHFRKLAEEHRKFNETLEADADKAAHGGDNKFSKMGVALLDATGHARDTIEVYKDIAEKISKIENPAERAAKAVEEFGRRVGTQLTPNLEKGRAGIEAFFNEAKQLGIILDEADQKIGKGFEASFGKMESVIAGALNKIGLAFAPQLQKITDAISEALGGASKDIEEWAKGIAEWLSPLFDDVARAIKGGFMAVKDPELKAVVFTLQAIFEGLKLAMQVAIEFAKVVEASFENVVKSFKTVGEWAEWLYKKLKPTLDLLAALTGGGGKAAGGGEAPAVTPTPTMAGGGRIRGAGTGTSDSINAKLSNGEYVVREASVSKYGVGMMDSINAGHFAMGGLAERLGSFMAPQRTFAFAGGGLASSRSSSGTPINLHIGGQSFGMTGDDHVVGSLSRYAAGKQMASAGAKPSWYGGR
jgi:hypothetical protein